MNQQINVKTPDPPLFHQADAIIEAGYQAMNQRIPDLLIKLGD